MSLEKKTIVDRIEVLNNGCVQVRTKIAIFDDGVQVSGTYHRHVIAPGDDYNNEDTRVQAVCASIHTPEVVEAYQQLVANSDI